MQTVPILDRIHHILYYVSSPRWFRKVPVRLLIYLMPMEITKSPLKGKARSKRKIFLKIFSWSVAAILIAGPSILHSQLGIGISPILTGSMKPFANPGDVFITKLSKASDLQVGDIITVHSQKTGVFYAHRVAKISFQSGLLRVVTKGDANPTAEIDPYMVAPNSPTSKTIFRVKWLGTPLVYLTSLQGRQAGLGLMVFANVVFLFMFLFRKQIKNFNPFAVSVYKELYSEVQIANAQYKADLRNLKTQLDESKINQTRQLADMFKQLETSSTYLLTKGN